MASIVSPSASVLVRRRPQRTQPRNPPPSRRRIVGVAKKKNETSYTRVLSCRARTHGTMAIHLDLTLPSGSSSYPMTRASSPYRHLLGLAPDEACHATYCYQRPGGLLHRRFTLTRRGRAVCSLLRYLSGHPGRTLSASCSMEPGSSSADPMKITAAASRGLKPAIIHKVRKGGIPPGFNL